MGLSPMTAEIHNIRDYQLKRDIAKAEADLNRNVFGIADYSREVSGQLSGSDPSQANAFHAPERDPA